MEKRACFYVLEITKVQFYACEFQVQLYLSERCCTVMSKPSFSVSVVTQCSYPLEFSPQSASESGG